MLLIALLVLVPTAILAAPSNSEKDMKGPVFIKEPDNRIDFSNSTGSVVECRANGIPPPEIIWVRSDGTAVGDVPGLRQVSVDCTIVCRARIQHCISFRFFLTAISCFHHSAPRTIGRKCTHKSTHVWPRIKSVPSSREMFMSELVSSFVFQHVLFFAAVGILKVKRHSVQDGSCCKG